MRWPTMNEEVDDEEEEEDGPNCAAPAAAADVVAISGGPTGTCPSRLRASIPIGRRGGSRVETLSPTGRHRCSLVVAGGVICIMLHLCARRLSLSGAARLARAFVSLASCQISRGPTGVATGRGCDNPTDHHAAEIIQSELDRPLLNPCACMLAAKEKRNSARACRKYNDNPRTCKFEAKNYND